jgi:hypothetical protein
VTKQCLFLWNGVEADGGGNFTLQPGEQPSSCVIRMRMGYTYPETGVLTLTDGYQTRHFRGCRIARSVVTSSDGKRWRELTILDRRWTWGNKLAAVYGEYNRRERFAGDVVNERSYRELASLCLDALGEKAYDVSALPHYYVTRQPGTNRKARFAIGTRVVWDGNNPADCLRQICEETGTEITLATSDTIRIVRRGESLRRPVGDPRMMDFQSSIEPPIVPRYLVHEGGHTQVQHDLPLEAVGMETDGDNAGTFVPINELSYRPTLGWSREQVSNQGFRNVGPNLGNAARKRAIDMARRHVYKTYRVGVTRVTDNGTATFPIPLPLPPEAIRNRSQGGRLTAQQRAQVQRYFTIQDNTERWRILPLYEELIPWTVGAAAQTNNAVVLGHWFDVRNQANRNNAVPNAAGVLQAINTFSDIQTHNPTAFDHSKLIDDVPTNLNTTLSVPWGYTVDTERGLVSFEEYTYFQDLVARRHYPALIRLRASFRVRDPISAAHLSQQFWINPGNPTALSVTQLEKRSDNIFQYSLFGSKASAKTDSNERFFVESALANLADAISRYKVRAGYSIPFRGFVFDYSPDGFVTALSLDVSEEGAGTSHVDFGTERSTVYTTLDELRTRRVSTYNAWLMQQINQKRAAGVIK